MLILILFVLKHLFIYFPPYWHIEAEMHKEMKKIIQWNRKLMNKKINIRKKENW